MRVYVIGMLMLLAAWDQQSRSIGVDFGIDFGFCRLCCVCHGGLESLLGAVACSQSTLHASNGDALDGFSLVDFASG